MYQHHSVATATAAVHRHSVCHNVARQRLTHTTTYPLLPAAVSVAGTPAPPRANRRAAHPAWWCAWADNTPTPGSYRAVVGHGRRLLQLAHHAAAPPLSTPCPRWWWVPTQRCGTSHLFPPHLPPHLLLLLLLSQSQSHGGAGCASRDRCGAVALSRARCPRPPIPRAFPAHATRRTGAGMPGLGPRGVAPAPWWALWRVVAATHTV